MDPRILSATNQPDILSSVEPASFQNLGWAQRISASNEISHNWATVVSGDEPTVFEIIGKINRIRVRRPAPRTNDQRVLYKKALIELSHPGLGNYLDDWFCCSVTNIQNYLGKEDTDTLVLTWDLNTREDTPENRQPSVSGPLNAVDNTVNGNWDKPIEQAVRYVETEALHIESTIPVFLRNERLNRWIAWDMYFTAFPVLVRLNISGSLDGDIEYTLRSIHILPWAKDWEL